MLVTAFVVGTTIDERRRCWTWVAPALDLNVGGEGVFCCPRTLVWWEHLVWSVLAPVPCAVTVTRMGIEPRTVVHRGAGPAGTVRDFPAGAYLEIKVRLQGYIPRRNEQ